MNFLLVFITLFSTLVFAQNPPVDPGSALTMAYSASVQVTNVARAFKYGVQINEIDATPTPTTFTCNPLNDQCIDDDHGFATGLRVTFTTTGTLPAPLALATTYFIIVVDVDTFKVATTLANAKAGIAIDITTAGIGVHTVNSVALSVQNAVLQGSNDCLQYFNLPLRATGDATKSGALSASGVLFLSEDALEINCVKVNYGIFSGQLNVQEVRKIHDALK